MSETKKITIAVGIILIITFIVFLPSLNNGFTNWDDGILVFHNKIIKDLSMKTVSDITKSSLSGNYYPLSLLFNAIEYYFFKLNPFIYHLNNLIFHLFNCLSVFWLILLIENSGERIAERTHDSRLTTHDSRLGTDSYPLTPIPYPLMVAFITAILFGIHPLHTEPVAWIAERRAMIYTFFFLASVISYLYYSGTAKLRYYWLSFILFILAALSKSMVVMLPFILILLDYFIGKKIDKKNWLEKAPFLVIAISGIVVRFQDFNPGDLSTFLQNILSSTHRLVFYLIKTVAPTNLSCLYHTVEPPRNIALYPPLTEISKLLPFDYGFSPIIVIVLIGLITFSKKHTKKIIFGSSFFLILILPALQILPVPAIMIADRYTYIPLIGLFYLVGEGFYYLNWKLEIGNWKLGKRCLWIVLIGIIGILSVLSWQRCKVWKNSITLWSDVITKYPHLVTPYHNRGTAFLTKKEYAQAITDFTKLLTTQMLMSISDYKSAYNNRAYAYLNQGEYAKAINDYNQALLLDPNDASLYTNRGNIYYHTRNLNKAMSDFAKALALNPQDKIAYNNRGNIYFGIGDYSKAIFEYTKALQIDSDYAEAYNNRGLAYTRNGEYNKAIPDYNQAIKLDSDYAVAYNNRGLTYDNIGEYDKALIDSNRALKINPDFAEAYNNRANAYYHKGNYAEAIVNYTQAIKIAVTFGDAYYNRAICYFQKGDYAKAWQDVERLQNLRYPIDPQFMELLHKTKVGHR